MFGRKARRLAAAVMGKTNARIASHFRRLQIVSTPSRPAPLGVSSAMGSLRHQDDVAVLEVEVLVLSSSRDDLVVVERDPRHGLSVGTKDDNPRPCGELGEPPP